MKRSIFAAALALIAAFPANAGTAPVPAPVVPTPAPLPTMLFAALETRDIAKAQAFYTNALGMKNVMRISRPEDPFIKDAFNFSGDTRSSEPLLILMHHDGPEAAHPASSVTLGMRVADARDAAARVRRAGYAVLREPPPEDHGAKLTTLVRDPDGNTIELVQLDLARMR